MEERFTTIVPYPGHHAEIDPCVSYRITLP